MSEETTTQQATQQPQQQQQQSKKIEMDEETYAALLDKMDELEQAAKGSQSKQVQREEVSEVDELAREGQQHQQKQQVNFDEMSPAQIVEFMRQDVGRNLGGPLMVAVNELKYTIEMDKLMRPEELGGNGFVDLLDYKDEIMSLMLENPKMTMKRAYTLAKVENPKKSTTAEKKEAKDGGDREARLRHLPPHPRRGSFGDRPGSAESSVREGDPKTLQDAAERAFDKVMKDR